MTIETSIITLPAYWASALVNGDFSGLNTIEIAPLKAQLDSLRFEGWTVAGVATDDQGEPVEPRFTWSYSLYGGLANGGEVLDYIILREARPTRTQFQQYVTPRDNWSAGNRAQARRIANLIGQ